MKIIIDIPQKAYETIKAEKEIDWLGVENILDCIKNGTPLPKGHGRLKDVDWIDDNCENHYSDKDGSWYYAWRDIDNAPTIIEADKEEEE